YNEFILTSLRTVWGIPLNQLQSTFNDKLSHYCLRIADKHLQNGTLELRNNALCLSRKGIFVSDGIISDLLWVEN
ncbi:MAG: coproporphyrinogen III oxidase, partial [Bacteroides sp.]